MQTISERPKTAIEYKNDVLTIVQCINGKAPDIIRVELRDIELFLKLIQQELKG